MIRLPAAMRAALLASLIALGPALPGSALQVRSGSDFVLPADQSVTGELWLAVGRTDIAGTCTRDVFVISSSNVISGTLHQDLWAIGDTVEVTGHIQDDARAVARIVSVSGAIGGNLLGAGETVQLSEKSIVQGDALLAGAHVIAQGSISGGAWIKARQVTLGGHIHGPVRVAAADIVVMQGTRLDGDLTYTSGKELFLDKRVQHAGQLVRKEIPPAPLITRTSIGLQAVFFLGALAVATPFVALFPAFTGRAVRTLRRAPWRCALLGAILFSLLPMLSILTSLTFVGLPLGLVLASAFFLLLYGSKVVVALAVGGVLLRRQGPQPLSQVFIALVLGLVLLYLCTGLPLVGAAFWLATVFCGMGGLAISLFVRQRPSAADAPHAANADNADPAAL